MLLWVLICKCSDFSLAAEDVSFILFALLENVLVVPPCGIIFWVDLQKAVLGQVCRSFSKDSPAPSSHGTQGQGWGEVPGWGDGVTFVGTAVTSGPCSPHRGDGLGLDVRTGQRTVPNWGLRLRVAGWPRGVGDAVT